MNSNVLPFQESQATNEQHINKWSELEERCSRLIKEAKNFEGRSVSCKSTYQSNAELNWSKAMIE